MVRYYLVPRNLATSFPSSNKTDICGLGHRATVCDPALRTVNTGAECGADEDVYYYRRGHVPLHNDRSCVTCVPLQPLASPRQRARV